MGRQVWALVPKAGDSEVMGGAPAMAVLRLAARDEPGNLGLDLRHNPIGRTEGALVAPEAAHDARGERRRQEDEECLEKADDEVHRRALRTTSCP